MRANLTLMFFIYLLAVFLWRHFSKTLEIQRAIHNSFLGPVLQWYALLLLGCAAMVGWTLQEFFGNYYGLSNLDVQDNLQRAYAMSAEHSRADTSTFEEFQERFSMPVAVQRFSMWSNLAGILVVAIAAAHIWLKFALPAMRIVQAQDDLEASKTPWWPAPRMNRLITMMIMPVMLSVMSIRGSCRIWALTTGQAENHFQAGFEQVKKWEIALYHMDQEVGQMFQFLSVYAFTRICGSFLNESLGEVADNQNPTNSRRDLIDSAKELRWLVRYAGFLAVWAFILVGIMRCLLEFLVAESHYYEVMEGGFFVLEESVLKPANIIFSFLTILCVVNMFIVGRTKTIKDRLGNANIKFTGARVLLIIIAVQEQAAQLLTEDSAVHDKVVAKAMIHGHDLSNVSLTVLQADLLHLSLLNFECLFVVIFNVIVWRDLDLKRTGVANYGYSNLQEEQAFEMDDEDVEEARAVSERVRGPETAKSATFRQGEHGSAPLLLGAQRNDRR